MNPLRENDHNFVKNLEPKHISWVENSAAMSELLGLNLDHENLAQPNEKPFSISEQQSRIFANIFKVAIDLLDTATKGYLLVNQNSLTPTPNRKALATVESEFNQAEALLDEVIKKNRLDADKPDFSEAVREYAEFLLAYSFVGLTLMQLRQVRTTNYHSLVTKQKPDITQFNSLSQVTPHTAFSFWNTPALEGEHGYRAVHSIRKVTKQMATQPESKIPPYAALSLWHFFTALHINNQALAEQSQEIIVADADRTIHTPSSITKDLDNLDHYL